MKFKNFINTFSEKYRIEREMLLKSSQKPIYVNPVMIILFIIIVNIIPNRDFLYSMNKQLDSQEYV